MTAVPETSRTRKLLLGAIVLGLTLLVIEGMLQGAYYFTAGEFLFRRTLPPIYAADPVRCYGLIPNLDYLHRSNEFTTHIYTNAQGFRTGADRLEHPVAKPPDRYRILVLGPSFAFGWGSDYEQIFPTLIEQQLRVPGRSVEVINLGTPSQDASHQLCWLERYGRDYAPDLLLQVVYGASVPLLPTRCPEPLQCPVVENGQLYSHRPDLKSRVIAFTKNFGVVFYGYYAVQTLLSAPSRTDEGKELYAQSGAPIEEGDLEALTQNYLEFERALRRGAGDDPVISFVHIPYSFVAHPEDAPRFRHLAVAKPMEARRQIAAQIELLRARGVPIVSAVSELVAAAARERQYYWLDIHLTPAGNASVAAAMLPELRGLVDRNAGAAPAPALSRPDSRASFDRARTPVVS